jgi:methionyl-tRNA synthetase
LRAHHEALEFRRAAAETRAIWARANAYVQEAPWTAVKASPEQAAVATRTALNLVRLSASVAWSIVPTLAGRVLASLGSVDPLPAWPTQVGRDLLAGQNGAIRALGSLVTKIGDAHVARLEARFGTRA